MGCWSGLRGYTPSRDDTRACQGAFLSPCAHKSWRRRGVAARPRRRIWGELKSTGPLSARREAGVHDRRAATVERSAVVDARRAVEG